ncbi:MAG: hypothetical protein PVH73_02230 [Candidatus Bathyarchaeota archaeon]
MRTAHAKFFLSLDVQNASRKNWQKRRTVKRRGFNSWGNHTEIHSGCRRTKKVEFEPADSLHRNWINYNKKHNINKDIEALSQLLDSSHVARNQEEILNALYDSTLAVLDSATQLDSEQKTRALYFSCNLCSCRECQKDCGAHINKKGQIRISKKLFHNTLNHETPPIGLLEMMYTILHQLLHGIFPENNEETINEKTEQAWKSGTTELVKQKLKRNS